LKFANLLYPVFHPVVDVNGRALYYEANMRAYGQRRIDGHARLIAVAEEIGFMDAIDCAIASKAIEAAGNRISRWDRPAIGVNVSAFTVQNEPECFIQVLRRARLNRCPLVVELTETVQPDRMDLMDGFRNELKRLNISIAVDDYGTGHFEASDIAMMQPEYLKIAMPRVVAGLTDQAARHWLMEAIELANRHGAEVIAEGIEDAAMLEFVERLGVRYFQGYLWGKPTHLLPNPNKRPGESTDLSNAADGGEVSPGRAAYCATPVR
jgi:EAL domain-containing protein (putative c-di-GMP-specific phosphodiesterase class I)